MVDSPLIWDVLEAITFEVFVGDPNTGAGVTGQIPFLTFTIQRDYDDKYWSGAGWVSALTTVVLTEVDSTNDPGRYNYTLSGSANNLATRYVAHVNIDNPPMFDDVDSYEVHVSRVTDIRVYESEPA